MHFSESERNKLKAEYATIEGKYHNLVINYARYPYKNKLAYEFAMHGFARRTKIMKRCIDNIYQICPLDIDNKLAPEELSDLTINLHAFYINTYGSLDNLAWIWVKERGILNKDGEPIPQERIGFSKKYKDIRNNFSSAFRTHLESLDIWFDNLENFRHSLAHRIPLYIPPYFLNENDAKREQELDARKIEAAIKGQLDEYYRLKDEIEILGNFIPVITHSYSEKSNIIVFHSQILADWNTIIDISGRFLDELTN